MLGYPAEYQLRTGGTRMIGLLCRPKNRGARVQPIPVRLMDVPKQGG